MKDLEQQLLAAALADTRALSALERWATTSADAAATVLELTRAGTVVRDQLSADGPGSAAVEALVRRLLTLTLDSVGADRVQDALTDPLTELPLRRLFERDASRALAAAQRAGGQMSVVMLDVNGLKQTNDGQGHAAGDALLREVSGSLRKVVRAGEGAYRIGGDEFAVLLPTADELAARKVMARFAACSGSVASWGIAMFPTDGRDLSSLLARADQRMYATRESRPAVRVDAPKAGLSAALAVTLVAVLSTGVAVVAAGLTGDSPSPRQGVPPAASSRAGHPSAPRVAPAAKPTTRVATTLAGRPSGSAGDPSASPSQLPTMLRLPGGLRLPTSVPLPTPPSTYVPPAGVVPAVTDALREELCALLCPAPSPVGSTNPSR